MSEKSLKNETRIFDHFPLCFLCLFPRSLLLLPLSSLSSSLYSSSLPPFRISLLPTSFLSSICIFSIPSNLPFLSFSAYFLLPPFLLLFLFLIPFVFSVILFPPVFFFLIPPFLPISILSPPSHLTLLSFSAFSPLPPFLLPFLFLIPFVLFFISSPAYLSLPPSFLPSPFPHVIQPSRPPSFLPILSFSYRLFFLNSLLFLPPSFPFILFFFSPIPLFLSPTNFLSSFLSLSFPFRPRYLFTSSSFTPIDLYLPPFPPFHPPFTLFRPPLPFSLSTVY